MKHNLFLLLITVIFFTACNNNDSAVNENIADTILPKGKYVVDEYSNVKVMDPNTGSFNDYNGTNSNTGNPDKSSAYDNLKKKYKNLLVFHAADTMKIKRSYIATLILGKDQSIGALKDEVMEHDYSPNDSLYTDTAIDFGSKMKARLIDMSGADNKGFIIELLGGEEAATQSLTTKRKKVLWQWKLTPQTPGQKELRLSINIIERDGETVNLPAKNIEVVIFAEKEGFMVQAGKFFNEYGKWILASILIPIFIAWFTTRMRNKSYDRPQLKTPVTPEAEKKPQTTANPEPPGPVSES
ncbi:MAG: hypothetical protein WBP16_17195 [Ferruginibacter sp.]